MSLIQNKPIRFNTEIKNTLSHLKSGEIILYPTDTIWGVGCDPMNEDAVEQIYSIKQRPRHMPLLLLVSSVDMLLKYTEDIHPRVETLLTINKNPLTVIYPKTKNLPDSLLHEDNSIGIRVANDPFCQALINKLGTPIISTSANVHGESTPLSFSAISMNIRQKVDYIVDYRREEKSNKVVSPIATFDKEGELTFIR